MSDTAQGFRNFYVSYKKTSNRTLQFCRIRGVGRIMGGQLHCVSGQKKSAITTSGIR